MYLMDLQLANLSNQHCLRVCAFGRIGENYLMSFFAWTVKDCGKIKFGYCWQSDILQQFLQQQWAEVSFHFAKKLQNKIEESLFRVFLSIQYCSVCDKVFIMSLQNCCRIWVNPFTWRLILLRKPEFRPINSGGFFTGGFFFSPPSASPNQFVVLCPFSQIVMTIFNSC